MHLRRGEGGGGEAEGLTKCDGHLDRPFETGLGREFLGDSSNEANPPHDAIGRPPQAQAHQGHTGHDDYEYSHRRRARPRTSQDGGDRRRHQHGDGWAPQLPRVVGAVRVERAQSPGGHQPGGQEGKVGRRETARADGLDLLMEGETEGSDEGQADRIAEDQNPAARPASPPRQSIHPLRGCRIGPTRNVPVWGGTRWWSRRRPVSVDGCRPQESRCPGSERTAGWRRAGRGR